MRFKLFFLIGLAVILAGCHSKDSMVAGKWDAPGGKPALTATADHKWSQGGQMAVEGTWAIDGDDALFTIVTIGGKPVADEKKMLRDAAVKMGQPSSKVDEQLAILDKPLRLKLSGDGKTMTIAPPGGQGSPITLTKES
jgi:hypothetical protein